MRIIEIKDVAKDYTYNWPNASETFDYSIEYRAESEDGEHNVKIGFGKRHTYGKDRVRIVVWIDEHPFAEFLGADDFESTGDVLSEIRVSTDEGERICKYSEDHIPERYAMFNVIGLPCRVKGKGVHNAWAVVTNIADHKTLITLAALRRLEKMRKKEKN